MKRLSRGRIITGNRGRVITLTRHTGDNRKERRGAFIQEKDGENAEYRENLWGAKDRGA
jgi:hypothetical protein